MKKKVFATFLATALTVTSIVGCGGSTSTPAPAAGGDDTAKTETADKAEDTTTEATEEKADAADATTESASTGKQTDGKNLPELFQQNAPQCIPPVSAVPSVRCLRAVSSYPRNDLLPSPYPEGKRQH